MRALVNRLRRLESLSHGGPCPCCLDWARPVVLREPSFYGAERGQSAEPASCPVCGRWPPVILLRRDPDFFANQKRLEELSQQQDM
jgi:hypothetical protein